MFTRRDGRDVNLIAGAFPTNPIGAAATLLELCWSHSLYVIFITTIRQRG
jgi:hypothetical protein